MKIVGLMPVRNEAWVIGLTARVALLWMDELIALNHASTDETRRILDDIARETHRLWIIEEPDDAWPEMSHRQRLLETARSIGATHCALVDADEVLTAPLLPSIRARISRLESGVVLRVPMRCMWRSPNVFRDDRSVWSRGVASIAFGDAPQLAWRAAGGYDHHHREPYGLTGMVRAEQPVMMHLQWLSWRRVTAKHAWYKMHERLRYPDKPVSAIDALYSQALDESAMKLSPAPAEWWAGYETLLPHLDADRAPWQEGECHKLWQQHGPQAFAGLNLFGVV